MEHSQGSPRVRPPLGLQAQTGTRRLQRAGQDTGQGELLSCIAGCDRTVSLERAYVMAVDEVPRLGQMLQHCDLIGRLYLRTYVELVNL